MLIRYLKTIFRFLALIFILSLERVVGVPFLFFFLLLSWLRILDFKLQTLLLVLASLFLALLYQTNLAGSYFFLWLICFLYQRTMNQVHDHNLRTFIFTMMSSVGFAVLVKYDWTRWTLLQLVLGTGLLLLLRLVRFRMWSWKIKI